MLLAVPVCPICRPRTYTCLLWLAATCTWFAAGGTCILCVSAVCAHMSIQLSAWLHTVWLVHWLVSSPSCCRGQLAILRTPSSPGNEAVATADADLGQQQLMTLHSVVAVEGVDLLLWCFLCTSGTPWAVVIMLPSDKIKAACEGCFSCWVLSGVAAAADGNILRGLPVDGLS
jgi:hypothetical protein